MVEKRRKPRYTLAELMAQCDWSQPWSEEERLWLDMPPVGLEFGAEEQGDDCSEPWQQSGNDKVR